MIDDDDDDDALGDGPFLFSHLSVVIDDYLFHEEFRDDIYSIYNVPCCAVLCVE